MKVLHRQQTSPHAAAAAAANGPQANRSEVHDAGRRAKGGGRTRMMRRTASSIHHHIIQDRGPFGDVTRAFQNRKTAQKQIPVLGCVPLPPKCLARWGSPLACPPNPPSRRMLVAFSQMPINPLTWLVDIRRGPFWGPRERGRPVALDLGWEKSSVQLAIRRDT